jgi:hypothetical protein
MQPVVSGTKSGHSSFNSQDDAWPATVGHLFGLLCRAQESATGPSRLTYSLPSIFTTLAACGPLAPCTISKLTRSPS